MFSHIPFRAFNEVVFRRKTQGVLWLKGGRVGGGDPLVYKIF